MNDLSPALLSDLQFAVSRYGLTVEEVPRDHEGKSITDRLTMLLADGESYCHGEYRKSDLRAEHNCVWELFPENPTTVRDQARLIDEAGNLLAQEQEFRVPPRPSIVNWSELPHPGHVAVLEAELAYIDGRGDEPVIDPEMWVDVTLFTAVHSIVPGLRDAEMAAITREQLVAELASGAVPPASAGYVRRLLDSDTDGLRNADITLAGYRVSAANMRDAVQMALNTVREHVAVAEQLRQTREDLEAIDQALHWPGDWRTAPNLPVARP